MEIKLFYKTQRELASTINSIVDAYWEDMMSDEDMMKYVSDIYSNNSKKFLKQDDFTTILKQQCGKRRLEVIERVLHINELLKTDKSVG